jgi:hypothetical protein
VPGYRQCCLLLDCAAPNRRLSRECGTFVTGIAHDAERRVLTDYPAVARIKGSVIPFVPVAQVLRPTRVEESFECLGLAMGCT